MDLGRQALNKPGEEKYSLIFYLTGTTAKACVVVQEGTCTRILATVVDAHFGGNNFTDNIVEHFKQVCEGSLYCHVGGAFSGPSRSFSRIMQWLACQGRCTRQLDRCG